MGAADEILDPGPVVWGEVTFVKMRHPETGGTMDTPPQLVEHYEQRGWETYDAPSPPELAEVAAEATLRMSRDELNDLARNAGVIEPEEFKSKQQVIDAINALAPATDPTNPPSSPDGEPSQED